MMALSCEEGLMKYIFYFIVGGLVVSSTAYYGSTGRGFIAALISMFPSMTVLTFSLIYRAGGQASVVDYAKNLVYGVPPWILYVFTVAWLCEHIGIWRSLTLGIVIYLAASFCISHFR